MGYVGHEGKLSKDNTMNQSNNTNNNNNDNSNTVDMQLLLKQSLHFSHPLTTHKASPCNKVSEM
jgi:hypothetical protein